MPRHTHISNLAPKRWCNECNKPVGRKWSNYNLCRKCTQKIMDTKKLRATKEGGDEIPY